MIEGDLLRLVGDFDGAEAAYQRANEFGRDPQPGLALLRLAQGRVDVADAMIRRVVGETEDPMSRARCSAPTSRSSSRPVTPPPPASQPTSSVCSPRNSQRRTCAHTPLGPPARCSWPKATANAALVELRKAFNEFHALGVRYEAARTRLLIADACAALGDHDAAAMESSSARAVLDSLGAATPSTTATERGITPRRSHRARARGPRPARPRQDEPRDRHRTVHQREDRGQPRQPHLHQARRHLAVRRHRLRLRPPSRLTINGRTARADVCDRHRCHR